MSSIVDELVIALSVDVNAGTFSNVKRITEGFDKIIGTVTKMSAAITAAVAGSVYLGDRFGSVASKLFNFSKATDVSTEKIQKWQVALMQSGAITEDAMHDISASIEALTHLVPGQWEQNLFTFLGGDKARKILASNDWEERLFGIADAIKEMAEQGKKTEAFQMGRLFGFSPEFINFLEQGSEKIKGGLRDAAKSSGLILPPDIIEKAASFSKHVKLMETSLKNLGTEITANFEPDMQRLDETLRTWIKDNHELISADIKAFVIGIRNAVNDLGEAIGWMIDKLGELFPSLKNWRTDTDSLAKTIEVLALTVIGVHLIGAFSGLLAAVGSVAAIFISGAFATPGGAVILALGAIAAAVLLLGTNWDTATDALRNYSEQADKWAQKRQEEMRGGLYDFFIKTPADRMKDMQKWWRGEGSFWGDRDNYRNRGRNNPSPGGSSSGGTSERRGTLKGIPDYSKASGGANDRAKLIQKMFMDAGFSRESAAALAGTFYVETGGSLKGTQQEHGGGPGLGLAQWTDRKRKAGLFSYAKEMKMSPYDEKLQVLYAIEEIKKNPHYKDLLKGGTLAEMVKAAVYKYEAPKNPGAEYNRAIKAAERFHKQDVSKQDITINQHIHGRDAIELADRSSRKINLALQRTFPGTTAPVIG